MKKSLFTLLAVACAVGGVQPAFSQDSVGRCDVSPMKTSIAQTLDAVRSAAASNGLVRPDGEPQPQAMWGRGRFLDKQSADAAFSEIKKTLHCLSVEPAWSEEGDLQGSRGIAVWEFKVDTYKLQGMDGPSISLSEMEYRKGDSRSFVVDVEFYRMK
jgi:hypothetical protein